MVNIQYKDDGSIYIDAHNPNPLHMNIRMRGSTLTDVIDGMLSGDPEADKPIIDAVSCCVKTVFDKGLSFFLGGATIPAKNIVKVDICDHHDSVLASIPNGGSR